MTRHDRPDDAPLMAGPRWYRARIRLLGPLLGLVPMALFGALSIIVLRSSESRSSGLLGLVSGVVAAPGLLVAGAPFADDSRYPAAIAGSALMWVVLGFLASRRATAPVLASWGDYWRELFWLTAAVAVGAIAALIAATLILSESLIY